jgi:predicted transcriptional regulator
MKFLSLTQRSFHRLSLGTLERKVMAIAWQRGSVSVRDVCHALSDEVAYTTLMTTLDRLHKKGLLERRKDGRAFVYSPLVSPEQLERSIARNILDSLLGRNENGVEPVLACIVEAVSDRDRALLDELDRLIKAKRRELKQQD